jgi:hypothetical protein
MTADQSHSRLVDGLSWADAATRSDADLLRVLVIAAGLCTSVLFVVVGLRYELQLYGDGAMFSYSVAVQDAWAFHWHNISGRLSVYLFCLAPAEAYVGLTGNPSGGIVVYGFLFFAAQILALAATFASDRSKGHIIFSYACFSTACLCPLVFGFPTEMWIGHALFWPAVAVCHYARQGIGGAALVFGVLLALIFTHEGAIVLAITILVTLLLRGMRHPVFLRAACALFVAMAIWATVKVALPPDDYFADVYVRAALGFFDDALLRSRLVLLLLAAIIGYGVIFFIFFRIAPTRAHFYAAAIVALALAVYWLSLDHGLHAANRYYIRTILVAVTPLLGALAAIYAVHADGESPLLEIVPTRITRVLTSRAMVHAIAGAFLLVMLVHVVETAKFVTQWTKYKAAVLALATSTASDPALGNPHLVSSARIAPELNRLSWYSTTPYLSVIIAGFMPTQLVVSPRLGNYFWLSCEIATANLKADRVVPAASRELVRIYSCLHR